MHRFDHRLCEAKLPWCGNGSSLGCRNEKTITQPPNISRTFEAWTLTEKDLRGIYNSMIDKMYGVLYLSLFVLVNDCCIWDSRLLGTT